MKDRIKKLGSILNPLGIFILFSLFALPALAVLNLSPKGNSSLKVLGTESKPGYGIVLVGGVHDYIKSERLEFPSENISKYYGQIISNREERLSKPILQLTNFSDNEQIITISGGAKNSINSDLYLMINEEEVKIQSVSGNIFTKNISLKPNAKEDIYLIVKPQTPILFNEDIEIEIVKK